MNRLEKIKESALFTIKFFDLLDFALKTREIHRFLFNQKAILKEVAEALEELKEEGLAKDSRERLWHLPSRSILARSREQKERVSSVLRRRLKFFGWIFRITPYIRTVAIYSNLAFNNASPESDIDLLVITRRDRLWISRLIVTILAFFLGLKKRRFVKIDPGKFCLSFFITEDHLDLSQLSKKSDLFRAFWIVLLDPIYNQGLFVKFLEANQWALKYFPNLRLVIPKTKRKPLSLTAFLLEKLIDRLPGDLNGFLFQKQKERIERNLPASPPAGGVVIKKEALKTHLSNKRNQINRSILGFEQRKISSSSTNP